MSGLGGLARGLACGLALLKLLIGELGGVEIGDCDVAIGLPKQSHAINNATTVITTEFRLWSKPELFEFLLSSTSDSTKLRISGDIHSVLRSNRAMTNCLNLS